MADESYNSVLRSMKKNYSEGSSWYFRRGIDLIEASKYESIEKISADLNSVRPGMGSLNNLSMVIGKAFENGMDAFEVAAFLRSYIKWSDAALSENLARSGLKGTFLTVSRSSEVLNLIKVCRPNRVYLMESRPGTEADLASHEMSQFTEVEMIPDSAIASFAARSDYILTGSDGFYSDGFYTNKTGTLPLLLSAEYNGKTAVVVSSSFKFSNLNSDELRLFTVRLPASNEEFELFERVPVRLIGKLVTDMGVFSSVTRETIMGISERFIEKCIH